MKKRMIRCLFLMFSVSSLHVAATESTHESAQYQLGAGDKIKVVVFGLSDQSGEFQLDSRGQVSQALLKDIKTPELTLTELETIITSKRSPAPLMIPKVYIETPNNRPLSISAKAKNPEKYSYVNSMTAPKNFTRAVSYIYRAKNNKTLITHVQHFQKETQQDTKILSGDVIKIPTEALVILI